MIVDDSVEDAESIVSAMRNAGIAVRPLRPASADELQSMIGAQPIASRDMSAAMRSFLLDWKGEAGKLPDEELLSEMGKYNEELVEAGIMLSGEGLKPSSEGVRVRFSGRQRTVVDGPFAETKELVAGFWLWQVRSLDEAIEWVKRCPNPMPGDSEIEIRPFYEAADLAEFLTPEQLAKMEQSLLRSLRQLPNRKLSQRRSKRAKQLVPRRPQPGRSRLRSWSRRLCAW